MLSCKKAFFSDQCKEVEENNRMGKTRDLFKKIRDTKGTFHVKMGSIKHRNGMDLIEAEDKKRWQEYTISTYSRQMTFLPTSQRKFKPLCENSLNLAVIRLLIYLHLIYIIFLNGAPSV